MVLKISDRNHLCGLGDEEGSGARFQRTLQALLRDSIANLRVGKGEPPGLLLRRQFMWDNVQQDGRDLRIGQMGGDPRPHSSRAQNGNFPDVEQSIPLDLWMDGLL